MGFDTLVAGETGGGALPTAVHRHQVDVDVHHQVGLGGPLAHLDRFALLGMAEDDHPIGVFSVVVVQQPVWGERLVDTVADGVTKL